MNTGKIREGVGRILNEKDCFAFFWEGFDGSDIDTVVYELEKRKVNYLIISAEYYLEETLKYMERFKTNDIPSCWDFQDRIRSSSIDLLLIHGYATIGLYQEVFETMMLHDINSRKGLLTKTVLATSGSFDSVICERLRKLINKNNTIVLNEFNY